MTKVLIGTPSYDGKLDIWYVNSLLHTIPLGMENGIELYPFWVFNDALVMRARNDLFKIAVEGNFDYMICIDGDMAWEPQWVVDLVKYGRDVVGGTTRKKTDDEEIYVTGFYNEDIEFDKERLMSVRSLGFGFVCFSKAVLKRLWEDALPYKNPGGNDSRLVCNVGIVNGELYGEDSMVYVKLREWGYKLWVDPRMCCSHIGPKKFDGDFKSYLKRLQEYNSYK